MNRFGEIVEAIKAAYPNEVGYEFATLWMVGDPNDPDNRAWNRIVAWISGGKETPPRTGQVREREVTACRWLRANFKLWCKDDVSGELRVHALYNAIDAALGPLADQNRGAVTETWYALKARTVSGWHVTLSFDVPVDVCVDDSYTLAQTDIDTSLPDVEPIVAVTTASVSIVADTEGFGPFTEPAPTP
jgi:hypothetical protein